MALQASASKRFCHCFRCHFGVEYTVWHFAQIVWNDAALNIPCRTLWRGLGLRGRTPCVCGIASALNDTCGIGSVFLPYGIDYQLCLVFVGVLNRGLDGCPRACGRGPLSLRLKNRDSGSERRVFVDLGYNIRLRRAGDEALELFRKIFVGVLECGE